MTTIAIIGKKELTEMEVINRFRRYYRAGDLIHFSCSFNENTAGDVSILDVIQQAIDNCTNPPIEWEIICPEDADDLWFRAVAQEIDLIFNAAFVHCYRKKEKPKRIYVVVVQ